MQPETHDFDYSNLQTLWECNQQLEFNAHQLCQYPCQYEFRIKCFKGILDRMTKIRLEKKAKSYV